MPPPDACRYADARPRYGDAAYGQPYDTAAMAHGVTLRCELRGGGPEVRLVVRGRWGIPAAVDVYDPPAARRPAQQLYMDDNDQRAYEGSGLVEGEDLNRDGWTDLKVETWSGTAGVFYDVFLYQPGRHRFVKDSTLSGGGGVVPIRGRETCVGTGTRTGMGDWVDNDFCWRGGRWVHVRQRQQERLGDLMTRATSHHRERAGRAPPHRERGHQQRGGATRDP